MEALLERVTFNENVLRGKPVIRGLRISVEMILELLANVTGRDKASYGLISTPDQYKLASYDPLSR